MDFIEQLFGISPDGGDGSLEALYVVALLAVVGAIFYRRRARLARAKKYAATPARRS